MIRTYILTVVLATASAGFVAAPASAAKLTTRSTAAECQALYDLSRNDSQSFRNNRDAYIECIGRL
jgi:hypothetical protein